MIMLKCIKVFIVKILCGEMFSVAILQLFNTENNYKFHTEVKYILKQKLS